MESFSDWFTLYHNGKPAKPSSQGGTSFTDRVALEHRMKQYEVEVERWKHSLVRQTRVSMDVEFGGCGTKSNKISLAFEWQSHLLMIVSQMFYIPDFFQRYSTF